MFSSWIIFSKLDYFFQVGLFFSSWNFFSSWIIFFKLHYFFQVALSFSSMIIFFMLQFLKLQLFQVAIFASCHFFKLDFFQVGLPFSSWIIFFKLDYLFQVPM